jgi:hypothetical protein
VIGPAYPWCGCIVIFYKIVTALTNFPLNATGTLSVHQTLVEMQSHTKDLFVRSNCRHCKVKGSAQQKAAKYKDQHNNRLQSIRISTTSNCKV